MASILVNSTTSHGAPTTTAATALGAPGGITTADLEVENTGPSVVWLHQDASGLVPSCQAVRDKGRPIAANASRVLQDPVSGTDPASWFIATDPANATDSADVRVE